MNKNRNRLITLLVILIFIGFLSLSILGYKDSSSIIQEDILNITRLVSTSVYSEIQNELIKPTFVSLTMANDNFVKNWVSTTDEDSIDAITQYLGGIQDKYGYDSTFFVSNITKNYYHYDGILKTIDSNDDHDDWFFDFLEKDLDYELTVDTDQAGQDALTLFVNCIVKKKDTVLGVTGVGVKMEKVQEILEYYQNELDIEIFLMSSDGTVLINADESHAGDINAFEDQVLLSKKSEILSSKDSLRVYEPNSSTDNNYLASYYIDDLDWYLIVHKDAQVLDKLLVTQKVKSIIVFLTAFLIVAVLAIKIASYYYKKTIKIANTDYLTEINNRGAFDEALINLISRSEAHNSPITLAIIDIDDFKKINDIHGHIEGDRILVKAAEHIKSFVRAKDIIARWGGDEFTIVFVCDLQTTHKVIKRIMDSATKNNVLSKYGVTFSIGVSQYRKGDTAQSLMYRADQALYRAKDGGKNRICDT